MSAKSNIHFEISERKLLLRVFDILFVFAALFLVSRTFAFDYFRISSENWVPFLVLGIYLWLFAHIFELYNLQKASKFEVIAPNILISALFTVLFYLFTPYYTPVLPANRLQILYFYLAIVSALLFWRWCYIFFITSPRFHKTYILVGSPSEIKIIYNAIAETTTTFNILGFCVTSEDKTLPEGFPEIKKLGLHELKDTALKKNLSEIIVAGNVAESVSSTFFDDLMVLLETGIPVKEYISVYEELTNRLPVQYLGQDFYKFFPFSRSNQNKLYLFANRVMDVLVSFIGLIVSLAFLPFVLVGNFLGNKGPLFYIQVRVGKNGVPFKIIKLRTMVPNAEKDGARWAEKNDTRITPFGNFLRRSRLDELPQFLNVLKGEMSLIGPRPERPVFVEKLSEEMPFYKTRHVIKPGLTGWAQVNTEYGASNEGSLKKLQYDLYYIKHRSLLLDIRIILKTLSTMLFYRGQ